MHHFPKTSAFIRPGILAFAMTMILTLVTASIVLASDGNVIAPAFLLTCIGLALLTWIRVDWSFYFFVGMVLLLDQYEIPGFNPYTYTIDYFKNLKENSFLPSLSIAVINPLEVHLVLMVTVWFITLGVKRLRIQTPPVWGAAVLFFSWLVGGLVYGLKSGGEILPALWEVRALFYLGMLFFFVPQIIQTEKQIEILFGVFIAAITFKAFQGIIRFVQLGFSFQGIPTLTNHEDPVFIVTLLIFLLSLVLFKVRNWQRTLLLWLSVPLLIGFFMGQRRAAYAAGMVSLAIFLIVIPKREFWSFMRIVFPVCGVLTLYCIIFWNSESKWGSPVRLIKSGFSTEKETAGERFYSNLYREFEKYNLASTVRTSPVIGIGFGKKYDQVIPLADIPFPLRDYIPHNEILWIVTKLGGAGFMVFCIFINTYVFKAVFVSQQLTNPYLKAICAVIIAAIVNQLVVSYYDLQLTFYRNMVYLGSLLGLLPTIENLSKNESPALQSPSSTKP